VNATKERQAWCCLQVKLCDPCLSALSVPWCKKALYKYSSFRFLSVVAHRPSVQNVSHLRRIVSRDVCVPLPMFRDIFNLSFLLNSNNVKSWNIFVYKYNNNYS